MKPGEALGGQRVRFGHLVNGKVRLGVVVVGAVGGDVDTVMVRWDDVDHDESVLCFSIHQAFDEPPLDDPVALEEWLDS